MKIRKYMLPLLASCAALLLGACSLNSTQQSSSGQAPAAVSGEGSGQQTQSGLADQSAEGTADQNSQQAGSSAAGDASGAGDAAGSSDVAAADTWDSQTQAGGDDIAAGDTWDSQTQAGPEVNMDEPDAAEGDWTGTWEGESGEVLTISSFDGSSISFSFAESGISSTAEVTGNEAVYHGDDNVDVVFDYFGDSISIGVVSQQDYDMSSSPINGTYSRQAE